MLRDYAARERSARDLGDAIGVSRNAVLGRAFRLGVKFKGNVRVARQKRMIDRKIRIKPLPSWQDRSAIVIDDSKPVTLMELTCKTCRWPLEEKFYCGKMPVENKPYCAGHCAISYIKPMRHK